MKCADAALWLDNQGHGEPAALAPLGLQQHLDICPHCAAQFSLQQTLATALSDPGLRYHASDALRQRISSAVGDASKPPPSWGSHLARLLGGVLGLTGWKAVGVASLLLLSGLGVRTLLVRGTAEPAPMTMSTFLACAVIGPNLNGHPATAPLQFVSSDPQSVRGWLSQQLRTPMPVFDLQRYGYHLKGARIAVISARPAAQVLYDQGPNQISLFISTGFSGLDACGSGVVEESVNGNAVVHWSSIPHSFWAASNRAPASLRRFADLARQSPQ